jgi:hypothetical protein
MILHVVLYQPRASATPEDLAALTTSLEVACREIPAIQQVRVGKAGELRVAYDGRSSGQIYEYLALFEFRDELDFRAYLEHPQHRVLGEMFWKVCERTHIMDVTAIDPLAGDSIGQLK